jgi:HD-GYP domain-containing protein (c-di-GMP phosphodiesterase class II)
MIQITNEELEVGMVLAKSVYHDNGELLLASGYTIDDKILPQLKKLNSPYFWIQEKGTETIIPKQLISDQISLQNKEYLRENVEILKEIADVKDSTKESIHRSMKDTKKFKNIIVTDKVKKSVSDIIDSLTGMESAMVNLTSIRTKVGFIYQHAIDVTATAIILANKLHFNRTEIEELALGCMLMDLGMAVIPDEIVNKASRLSFQEFNILKEHTTYGFTILKENPEIPPVSCQISYQHHERQDGAGYPRRLRGNNEVPIKRVSTEKGTIHRYAEIAAVADTYIALISPRPHISVPKSPEHSIRTLITAASSQLNRAVVDALITLIPVYPVGTRIIIVKDDKYNMTGYTGVVARYRHKTPDKPCITIMFNRKKEKIKPFLLDLAEEPGVAIQFVVLS